SSEAGNGSPDGSPAPAAVAEASTDSVEPIVAALGGATVAGDLSATDDAVAGEASARTERSNGATRDAAERPLSDGVYVLDASNRRRHFLTFREACLDVRNNEVIVLDFEASWKRARSRWRT